MLQWSRETVELADDACSCRIHDTLGHSRLLSVWLPHSAPPQGNKGYHKARQRFVVLYRSLGGRISRQAGNLVLH